MEIKAAIAQVEKQYRGLRINDALDLGNAWVFGFCGENGQNVDISPCIFYKATGEIKHFFPPDHIEELRIATEVNIESL